MTKGPFNALSPVADLNAALVSFVLTGLGGFSSAAGHIGPNVRVGHDISLLIPEVWCRMTPQEREPQFMIEHELLEAVQDFEHKGQAIPAGRLGYRITDRFVRWFFGRVFDKPDRLFDASILRPEEQDLDAFADGMLYIAEAQQQVAQQYFDDGSIEQACPPLQALLTIMAQGSFNGKTERDPSIRAMFSRAVLVESDWYKARLKARQHRDVALWSRHAEYLEGFTANHHNNEVTERLDLGGRKRLVDEQLRRVQAAEYLQAMVGMLGVDPALGARPV